MKIFGNSDIGLVRRANEDSFRCEMLSEQTALLIVCDGMGGAKGGSVASSLAMNKVFEVIRQEFREDLQANQIHELLLKAIEEANTLVYRSSLGDPELSGMGTTVVASVVQNADAYIVHVGDSRAYCISAEGIKQLTTDHSMVQELVQSGDLTALQAKTHPQKNIITRAVGVDEAVAADFYTRNMKPGDILLLCSDGLTNYVDDDVILKTVQGQALDQACNALIALAKENGGGDNITVAALLY